MSKETTKVLAVALNPAIDRGIEVPNFAIGAHQVGRQLFRRAAGKAVNVARVLAELGVATAVTGFVGRDEQEYFEQHLNGANVSCQLFAVEGQTRENITIMDPVTKVDTHIRDRGFEVGASDLTKLKNKLSLVCREDMLVAFSGSLPTGLEITNFLELVTVCKMQGAKVCVDSAGAVLRACASQRVHLIKPNFVEISEMLEEEFNVDRVLDVAEKLVGVVDIAIVSCGGDGGFLFSGDVRVRGRVPVDADRVTNTVGCGDAMLAGFLAGQLQGRDLADSYRFSLAVATAGAVSLEPGQIDHGHVDEFYKAAIMTSV